MAKVRKDGTDVLVFKCPGCKTDHSVSLQNPKIHTWDGNVDNPTLSPSVLYSTHPICHSWVKNGFIEFLSDCEHELAGKTIELPEL